MRTFKILTIVMVCALCLTDLVSAAEKKKTVIGFIPMTLSNEYFVTMVNAAKIEAEKQNVNLLVQAGAGHGNIDEQMGIMEDMIAKGVDAICIVPSSAEGLIPAIKTAQKAKIPVINLDTRIDPDIVKKAGLNPIPYIGTNNYDGAKKGGEYAIGRLGIYGKKVAILTGISHQENAKDRRNGFRDAVAGKVNIVAEASANWEVEQGYSVFQNILQTQPDIGFVFASNDNMGLGAVRAARETGREDISIMGYDAIDAALKAVEKGTMAATVAQMPAEMGIAGIRLSLEMLRGTDVPNITYTETKVIDSSNVAEFRKYLSQFK
jgi:ribose transport system substrate-binding protein